MLSQPATHPVSTGNGPDPNSKKKRRIATTEFDGSSVSIKFQSGDSVHLDASKIPGAGDVTGIAASVLAYGAAGIIQSAYGASERPAEAAKTAIQRLLAGNWSPGRSRAAEAEPDELTLALSEHLKLPVERIEGENGWLVKYANKHSLVAKNGGPGLAAARRRLRLNSDLAPIIARIVSERAKRMVAAAKGHKEDLSV